MKPQRTQSTVQSTDIQYTVRLVDFEKLIDCNYDLYQDVLLNPREASRRGRDILMKYRTRHYDPNQTLNVTSDK